MTLEAQHMPELLAPAGGPESLRAAIAGGADAVYLGVDRLNARRGAENFSVDALPAACRLAHLQGVRVYLAVNVVVHKDEMAEALELIDAAWTAGVDAIIVQDLGLLRAVRETLSHVRLHASTQIDAHSSGTVGVLASRGVSRVTLARETSLREISALVGAGRTAGVEVESFVHGALCVCYSGQCLLSSVIGGRSANRGQCAQPCRLPYELVDDRGDSVADAGSYLLSPKDLASVALLPSLVDTGVAALKIEGRMKSAEYVALVTGVYRAALDRALEAPGDYSVREAEDAVLGEAFSRGFSEAYLVSERGNKMMSYRRPNNRGVLVGRIVALEGSRATVALDVPLESQDTIEVWTTRGRFAQRAGGIVHGGGTHRSAPGRTKVNLELEKPAGVGDRVFRVRNSALVAAAERTYSDPAMSGSIPLFVSVRVVVGETLLVTVEDRDGRRGVAEGAVIETARTRPVTVDDVTEHVGRVGGTPYAVASWDVTLTPGSGVGFSELHGVRRAALEAYEQTVLEPWSARRSAEVVPPALSKPYRMTAPAPRLVAAVSTLAGARACLQAGCDTAYVPAWELDGEPLQRGIVPYLPRVSHDREERRFLDAAAGATRVLAGTLGTIAAARASGAEVEAHWSLNALNAHAVAELADLGASFVWLSPELSGRQIAEVTADSVVPVGVAVSGRQEVMVTEHCILMAEGECKQNCAECKRRLKTRYLRDRKGFELPLFTDPTGRSHLYNAVPLDLTASFEELLATGVSALRLDLETVPPNTAAAWVARVREALQDTLAGRSPVTPEKSTVTSGHFYRGVS